MSLAVRLAIQTPARWSATKFPAQSRAASYSAIHRGQHRSRKASAQGAGYRLVKDERNMKKKGISDRPRGHPHRDSIWTSKKNSLRSELSKVEAALGQSKADATSRLDEGAFQTAFRTARTSRLDSKPRSESMFASKLDTREDSPSARRFGNDPGHEHRSRSRDTSALPRLRGSKIRPTTAWDNYGGKEIQPQVEKFPTMRENRNVDRKGTRPLASFDDSQSDRHLERTRRDSERNRGFKSEPGSGNYNAPPSIPRATAASQFLYGFSVVADALRARKRKFYKLYMYRGEHRRDASLEGDNVITSLAERIGVPTEIMRSGDQKFMDRIVRGRPHNGYILEASPLPQMPLRNLGRWFTEKGNAFYEVQASPQSTEEASVNGEENKFPSKSHYGRKPFIVLVDGVQDEGNLGSIIRSASFLGVDAVVISSVETAKLSAVSLKASAGAAENVRLFSTQEPARFIGLSRSKGWKVFTSAPSTGNRYADRNVDIYKFEGEPDPLLNNGCVLVLGGEGKGVRLAIRRQADAELSIPDQLSQTKSIDSLNVSVAAGILMDAFARPRTRTPRDTQSVF